MSERILGHRETQHQLPRPLEAASLIRPGTWALPATTISWGSILVLAIVFLFLVADNERWMLFKLPLPVVWMALASAALAWLILVACRGRPGPGRHLPRIWTLSLVLLTTLSAAISLYAPPALREHSLVHIAVLALLASVLALVPRLFKLGPQSPTIGRIAPCSLLFTLLLILPTAGWVSHSAIQYQAERVQRLTEQLQTQTKAVQQVAAFNWPSLAEKPEMARELVDKIAFSEATDLQDPTLWKAADLVGGLEGLAEATKDLRQAVVESLDPQNTPKLSSVAAPAIWWDAEAKQWKANPSFPDLSATVGLYHRHLVEVFLDLETVGIAWDEGTLSKNVLAPLDRHYRVQQEELQKHLRALARLWPDHWVAYQVPRHQEFLGRERMPLVEVLASSLVEGQRLAPANLGAFRDMEYQNMPKLARTLSGCHEHPYRDQGYEYYRLDCSTFTPAEGHSGKAVLRLEMRVVFKSAKAKSSRSEGRILPTDHPVEIYFIFPISKAEDLDVFKDQVINGLYASAKTFWPHDIQTLNRESPNLGFNLMDQDGEKPLVRVQSPKPLNRYNDQLNALELRAILEPN